MRTRTCLPKVSRTFVSSALAVRCPVPPVASAGSPPRQHALPVRVDVLPHLRFIVPLAQRNLLVPLPTPRHLIVIQVDPQPRLVGNPHAPVYELHPSAFDHL